MKRLSRTWKLLLVGFAGLAATALIGLSALWAAYLHYGPELPEAGEIGEPKLNEPLRVYTSDGRLIGEFGTERRVPLSYDEIPPQVVRAFLAAEDDRFFEHPGVDYQGLMRAAWHVLWTGRKTQGGSTITMQLARNLYLTRERTYVRKFKEILLALRMEAKLSKAEILEIYLNKIYLGNHAYGVGAAARVYYDKPLAELNLSQMAMIAGLPKAPSRYNPLANPGRAKVRRDYVLARMRSLGYVDDGAYREAVSASVSASVVARDRRYEGDYIAEMVRQRMVERYGEEAYKRGLEVTTTIAGDRQRAANRALRRALLDYDRRHEWRGAEATLDDATLADEKALAAALAERRDVGGLVPAVVMRVDNAGAALHTEEYGRVSVPAERMPWLTDDKSARDLLARGDVVRLAYTGDDEAAWELAQVPEVQGALVALDPVDGAVQALIGGFDFETSKFNRAIQARRQPGSAFKPFLYSAALANGFTPASIINDAPVVFDAPGLAREWRPQNYSGRVHGPTRLREALVHSRNLVSIRLLRAIGIETVISHIGQFGLPVDRMPEDLSMALGSATFSPMQMARAYGVFANGGRRIEPYYIKEIRDGDGEVLYEAEPVYGCDDCAGEDAERAPRVLEPQNAYIMDNMMRDVIRRGTGRRALQLGRSDLAGKTGTTNDQKDTWFAGYNHALVTVSWVGFDQMRPLGGGESGAKTALPMWVDFMGNALQGVPEETLSRPSGVVTVRINPETGKLAGGDNSSGIFETFRRGNVPEAESTVYTYDGDGETGNDDVERLF